jgi:GDSL-like Lipase/Acylhydrolase family
VMKLPVLPELTPAARANVRDAYQRGKGKGLNANVFSKLGDCMTENSYFLIPFADGDYALGQYTALKPVLERFSAEPARSGNWKDNALGTPSLSAAGGFNVAAPLDPTWSNPEWCKNSESPIECEFRVARPAFAVIMFGTNDVAATDADAFNYYLRTLIKDSLDAGVVPIMSTFPHRPEDPEKTLLFNRITVAAARDYQVPVMNLYRALETLPDRGVNTADTIHLNAPPDGRTDIFDDEHLRYGFTMRNLVTLQALNTVLTAAETTP